MAEWLVIALEAPFASFADQPGNTTRKTGDMPTRSSLIGLAGAALGVRREDASGQAALSAGLVTASALIEPGSLLADFHTYESLHQAAKGVATRAEALRRKEHLNTSITRRDYRTDALWQAAFRLSETPGELTLGVLADAFRKPVFVLSLGRRSCTPSHPLCPEVVSSDDVREAFAAHARALDDARTAMRKRRLGPARLHALEDPADAPGANSVSAHWRRDQPRDRSSRWTFSDRREWRIPGGVAEEESGA
uniref:type I-E CRISPR-associated protein Cas5/CasD n=1 Tax=Stappia sp. TaxID=1870903 RepID=UPI003BA85BEF